MGTQYDMECCLETIKDLKNNHKTNEKLDLPPKNIYIP